MSQLQDLQSQELVLRGALSATAESDDPGEVEQCDEAESQEAILESQLEVVVNKQITLHNEVLVLRDDPDRGKQSTIALDDFMKDALELGSRFNDFRASIAANEGADSVQRSATSFCNLLLETKWTKSFYLHWMAEHCGSQQAHIHETISRETGLHSFHVQASENLNNSQAEPPTETAAWIPTSKTRHLQHLWADSAAAQPQPVRVAGNFTLLDCVRQVRLLRGDWSPPHEQALPEPSKQPHWRLLCRQPRRG